ncbi:MAG TPA: hypothetical protein VK894_14725 [Jiangellales bacterium]|nr:hypothetical protein [Jiangellales bacterium]
MRRWVKVVLAVVAGTVAACLLAVLGLAATLAGGVDHLFHRTPDPRAADVTAARQQSGLRVQALAAELRETGTTALGGSVAGEGGRDACTVGQHTWKRDDPFDLRCAHDRVVLVVADPADFRTAALALHAGLSADGWSAEVSSAAATSGPDGGLPWVVSEYWDTQPRSVPEADDVARLPTCYYHREGDEVVVAWAREVTDEAGAPAFGPSLGDVILAEVPVAGPDGGPAVVPQGRAVAVLTVRSPYWDR